MEREQSEPIDKNETINKQILKEDSVISNIDKHVTASPNQSPGKSVRIKENGAKVNGENVDGVRMFVLVFLFSEIITM